MKTSEFFKQKTVLSLEVFPPKRTAPVDTVYKTLDGLKGITPDFIGGRHWEQPRHLGNRILHQAPVWD